ncbi:MAG: GAF domain-containing protein [Rhizobiales bacterium]|nr:GAF domain-containing protein [Hyphomicrobiales bacterium]
MSHVINISDTIERLATRRLSGLPLSEVIDALPAAVYTTDAAGRIDLYNQAAIDLWGREPDPSNELWCGSWRLFSTDGTPLPHDECPMARALKLGQAIRGEEAIAERPDGSRVHFLAHPTPLLDDMGKVLGAVNMLVDVTAQKQLQAELKTRVEQLELVSELGLVALASEDLEAVFDQAVVQLSKGLKVELVKVLELLPDEDNLILRSGVGWEDGLVGKATVGAGPQSQAGFTLMSDRPVVVTNLQTEKRFNGPRLLLDHGVVSGLSVIIRGQKEVAYGVLGAHCRNRRDFTLHDIHLMQSVANILAQAIERRNLRTHQNMLVREVSHRVKNSLSVIQAIARQSGSSATSVEDFTHRFQQRLNALAVSHDMLTCSDGSGVGLRQLTQQILGNQADSHCLELDIDDLQLSSTGTQSLTMVFHELLTNALKYGALSCNTGKLVVKGQLEGIGATSLYYLTWTESGGPPVSEPSQHGFGSKLISAILQQQCKGELQVDWRSEGLLLKCALPTTSITSDV